MSAVSAMAMPVGASAGTAAGGSAGAPPGPAGEVRAVSWVAPVLYAAVLAGGLSYGVAGSRPVHPLPLAGLAAGLAALLGLDTVERRCWPARTPARPAVVLLIARAAGFAAVAAVDGSGLSRVLFVLVPFTAYFAFGRVASIALAVGCVGLVLAGFALRVPDWYARPAYVSDLLMLCVGLVLAVSMAGVAVGEQRGRVRLERTVAELADSHTQLRGYAARVAELSATNERYRLARDIHDSLGHHLTAVAVQLEKAAAFRDRDGAVAEQAHADARSAARRALEEVRQSVRALRDDAPPFRLCSALVELARQVDGDGLAVTVAVTGQERGYGLAALTAMYRAAQEGLTNARRHGGATAVWLSLTFGRSGARLVIEDNGRGFGRLGPGQSTSDQSTSDWHGYGHGYGLLGMRERVLLLGGQVELGDRSGGGATVTVTVPGPSTSDATVGLPA